MLKNGGRVQTGMIATVLHNLARYDWGELRLLIPTLMKVGLFNLFSAEEWIAGTNPGRRFVGQAARAWPAKGGDPR